MLCGPAAAQDDASGHVELPLPRVLREAFVRESPAHELVGVVNGHEPVPVEVSLAAGQTAHEHGRESGRLGRPADVVAVERVLSRVGRREHDQPARIEMVCRVHGRVRLDLHALRERSAVAAVEEQDLAPRSGSEQQVVDDRGRDRGRTQSVPARVPGRKVQPAALVLEPVAGEVEQEEIATVRVDEEAFHGLRHLG
jgi:hypothetical protein